MAFIEHPPPGTWRESPFVPGCRYRVLKEAQSHEGCLTPGEVLEYFGAYPGSHYGVSVFAFTDERNRERTWVLGDDEPLVAWSGVFGPVADP